MRIFVYGTLRSGETNHCRLQGSRLLGHHRTEPGYTLVRLRASLGGYPALLEGGTTSVPGEVYDVEEGILPALDRFEGHPHFYQRKSIRLLGITDVEAYVLLPAHAERAEVIAGGEWQKESAARSDTLEE